MIAFKAVNGNNDIASIIIGFTKEDITNLLSGLGCCLSILDKSDNEIKCLFFVGECEDDLKNIAKRVFD
jgi:hypothetical protein